ncbi:MAG: hypothetical protein RLZZ437_2411, partial [Pseudomonadota bacterium]
CAHGLGSSIVGCNVQLQAAKGGQLLEKRASPTVEVCDGVGRINVEVISRAGHQLRESKGTSMADSALGIVALNLDHRLEEGGPLSRRKLEPRESRMILIAGGNQPDRRKDIPWGCNAFSAVRHISGGISPLPFPGLFFNRFRAERYNQLSLPVVAQDRCIKRRKLDVTALPYRLIPADHLRPGRSACQCRQHQRQQARRDGRG